MEPEESSRKKKLRGQTERANDEIADAVPSKRRSSPSDKASLFAIGSRYPEPPKEYLDWLSHMGVSASTAKVYKYNLSHFLGFVAKRDKTNAPTLDAAWDIDCCAEFLVEIKKLVSPSTATGYITVLSSLRSFLSSRGRQPENFKNLEVSFQLMAKCATRARTKYIQETKRSKGAQQEKFGEFYRQVYRSTELWNQFYQVVGKSKEGGSRPSGDELFKVTCFVICLLLPGNWKRAGNISLLKQGQSVEALNDAVCKFRKEFPNEKVHGKERRLNKEACFPAILRIESSSKKGDTEHFCIFAPRDQRAILYYNEYVRPKSECDRLFVDSNGKPLTNVSRYVRAGALAGGIENLTINLLRSCAETVSAESTAQLPIERDSEAVATFLGHSIRVRDDYYMLPNDRHIISTASRLLHSFEEEGEKKTETSTSAALYDPVGEVS